MDYDKLYGNAYLDQQEKLISDTSRQRSFLLLPPYLAFAKQLGQGKGKSLLDYGCGAGRFLLAAKRLGWQAQGFEISADAASRGRRLGLEISCGDPAKLLQVGRVFECITLFDVIEHLQDPAGLLRDLLAVLRPGGSLFITVPNWGSQLMRRTTKAEWLPPVHLQFFTMDSLQALISTLPGKLELIAYGRLNSDPRPPVFMDLATDAKEWKRSWFALEGLRWLSRRLRCQARHPAQLYLHARSQA